ncbi:MAG: hypothetical protein R2727_04270 [Bacteroidales bacterium]
MTQCPDCDSEESDEPLSSLVMIMRVPSVELYFIKHYSSTSYPLTACHCLTGKYTMAREAQ